MEFDYDNDENIDSYVYNSYYANGNIHTERNEIDGYDQDGVESVIITTYNETTGDRIKIEYNDDNDGTIDRTEILRP